MSQKNAKQKRREEKAQAARAIFNEIKKKNIDVDLLKTVQILDKMVTVSLCVSVFQSTRIRERQREWSLYALVQFWNAVIVNAPRSLRQALEEAAEGKSPEWPEVQTTPEAFFQRSQNLSWRFFAKLYEGFSVRARKIAPPSFAVQWADLRSRFSEIWIADGSTLDAIAHRLKILRAEAEVVLPGCILACYDLFRGYAPLVEFSEQAMEGELKRLERIQDKIPEGTLLLADRLYATGQLFAELSKRNQYGLFRRHNSLRLKKIQCLARKRLPGGVLEDGIVEASMGRHKDEKQTLRWIRFRSRKLGDFELLTNVLDPERLSAEEAMELYENRWDVERLFYDLKEVLNLHRFYAGNINAVGMQVYATALVHTAMRIAQGRIAQQHGIAADSISTAKFFPRMAAAHCRWTGMRFGVKWVKDLNPGVKLKEPNWNQAPVGRVKLHEILVEPRCGPPAAARKTKSKARWRSLSDVVLHTQN